MSDDFLKNLTQEDLDILEDGDLAAFAARKEWLVGAQTSKRRGKQIPPTDAEWQILLFLAGRGFGKLLPLETPLPTPTGWVHIGDIQVGDKVFDEAGIPCNVTFISSVETPEKAYRLTFSDGTFVDACSEHQWVTWTHAERKAFLRSPYEDTRVFPDNWPQWRMKRKMGPYGEPKIYDDSPGPQIRLTQEIYDTLTFGKRGDTNHCIPTAKPLVLPDAELVIDPYVLGYWLGNGTTQASTITIGGYKGDKDHDFVVNKIQEGGYETTLKPYGCGESKTQIGVANLHQDLKFLSVLGNKHIPTVYLRASAAQRLALMRGLMDSDGHATGNNVEFCSTTAELARDFLELARSLGQKPSFYEDRARLNGEDYGPRYRVVWRPTINPFCLPRKAENVPSEGGAQSLRNHHRMIVDCQPIEPVPMRCISVDSPNAMYLAGEGMIPTHNTRSLVEWLWWECWRHPNLVGHAIAPTLTDVRGTIFEGPAGFCSIVPKECMKDGSVEKAYNKSTHELRFANGSVIRGFSATDDGSRLRGPQCAAMICDEVAQWDKPAGNLEQTMSNALFGLRLKYKDGTPSRAVMATTPLPIPYLKRFIKRPGVLTVRGTSYENMDNLDDNFRIQLKAMEGTLLGKQEIYGSFIDEESDLSIIKRRWINIYPYFMPDGKTKRKLPTFDFIIESYDTATSETNYDRKKQTTDPSASIVLGVFNVNRYFSEQERRQMGVRSKYAVLLCDAWDERLGLPELLEKAREQHRIKWGADPARRPDITLIEDKSSGPSLRQFLMKYGVPCHAYNPGRESKTTRLHGVAPLARQGLVFIPESDLSIRPDRKGLPRNWAEPFLEQVCAYAGPGSTEHDEYVDTFSSAMSYLRDRSILDATPETPYIDREEKRDADLAEAKRIQSATRPRITPNPYAS